MRPSVKLTASNKVDKIIYVLDVELIETYYELSTLLESLDIKYSFEDNMLILEKETGDEKKFL